MHDSTKIPKLPYAFTELNIWADVNANIPCKMWNVFIQKCIYIAYLKKMCTLQIH